MSAVDVQALVREFHTRYGLPTADHPTPPDVVLVGQRIRLILEEAAELQTAARHNDLIGVADALADLVYVVYGTAVTYGIDLEPIILEVHRSNLTKQGGTIANGKVRKGPGYQPPRIADLLTQQAASVEGGAAR